jgi:hypothetical protein
MLKNLNFSQQLCFKIIDFTARAYYYKVRMHAKYISALQAKIPFNILLSISIINCISIPKNSRLKQKEFQHTILYTFFFIFCLLWWTIKIIKLMMFIIKKNYILLLSNQTGLYIISLIFVFLHQPKKIIKISFNVDCWKYYNFLFSIWI